MHLESSLYDPALSPGNYDANVMCVALSRVGLAAQWLDYKSAQRAGATLLDLHKKQQHHAASDNTPNAQQQADSMSFSGSTVDGSDPCAWPCICGCGENLSATSSSTTETQSTTSATTVTPSTTTIAPHDGAASSSLTQDAQCDEAVRSGSCPLTMIPNALLLLSAVKWDKVKGVIINVAGSGGLFGSERHWAAVTKIEVPLSQSSVKRHPNVDFLTLPPEALHELLKQQKNSSQIPLVDEGHENQENPQTVQVWVNVDSKLTTPKRLRCMASALLRLWQQQQDATVLIISDEQEQQGIIPGRE